MGKPTICICENKGADQLLSNCEAYLISTFVFAARIVHILFFLNPKFQASSLLLRLYRSVCVGPVRKPHCWFSHEAAHLLFKSLQLRALAEARAREEQLLREAEQERLKELEAIKKELERLLAEERQAKKDEEIVRALQAK